MRIEAPVAPEPGGRAAALNPPELLRAAFDASPDACLVIDGATRRVLECNQRARDLFQLAPFSEGNVDGATLLGDEFFSGISGLPKIVMVERQEAMSSSPGKKGCLPAGWTVSWRRTNDGGGNLLVVFLKPDSDAVGPAAPDAFAIGALCSHISVALASRAVHEINNHLTSVMGNAALGAADPALPERLGRCFGNIDRAARQMNEICRELMLGRRGHEPRAETIDPNEIIKKAFPLLRLAGGKGSQVHLELADDLPSVQCDATELRHALVALVLNASEAFPKERGRITITTLSARIDATRAAALIPEGSLAAGEYAVIEIKDSGPGFPPEIRQRLFKDRCSTKGPGRGMGLTGVLGFARRAGGGLEVQDEPGVGLAIRIVLPVAAQSMESPHSPSVPSEQRAILVVEDEDIVRKAVARMVESFGLRALAAPDGATGMKLFAEHAPAIVMVLADANLPDMTGLEVIAAVRKEQPFLRALLMSGYGEEDCAGETGLPVEFLPKPFAPAALRVKLQDLLPE